MADSRYRLQDMIAVFLLVLLCAAAPASAALPPGTVVALWVSGPATHGEIPSAMPARFVLLEDGRVFVGGTSVVASARLPKKDQKAIDKLAARVRKLSGLGAPLTMGSGEKQFRLFLRKGPEILARGTLAQAPAALRPLAQLLETLETFTHPDLRPFSPESFAVTLHESALAGGCRDWQLPVSLAALRKGPALIPAAVASGWPTGGYPASVCDGNRQVTVTLRPLLPGETL
jgi:hypothetical protein